MQNGKNAQKIIMYLRNINIYYILHLKESVNKSENHYFFVEKVGCL